MHRIGRTARAGAGGIAISFCDPSERAYLRDIEKLTRNKIEAVPHDLPPLTEADLAQERQHQQPPRPHGHKHGKPSGSKPGGGHRADGQQPTGEQKKRNGSRPHWHRSRDKKQSAA